MNIALKNKVISSLELNHESPNVRCKKFKLGTETT